MARLTAGMAIGFKMAMVGGLLALLPASGFADVAHFLSGKSVEGKLYRVTGDFIEFKEGNNYGSKINIHRIQLTNRHDIVEVKSKKCYFGEIVYVDRFKLDLMTATGLVSINRLKISNVVIGSPAQQPVSNTEAMPGFVAPADDKPLVHLPVGNAPMPNNADGTDEDMDAIPAVDR